MKLTSILIILLFAFTLAACGGGGSSGPATGGMDDDTGGMDDDMAKMCPEGQTGTYPDCMDPAAEAAADKAEAERVAGAIGPDDYAAPDAYPTSDTQDEPFTVDGKMFTEADLNGAATTDDKDDDFAKSDIAPAGISGWTGASYMRTTKDDPATPAKDETTIDRVVFYTDQADKTSADYGAYFGGTVDTDHNGDPDTVNGVDHSDGVLTLTSSDAFNFEAIEADFGITAPSQTGLVIAPDTAGTTTSTRAGTFYGVPGTFTCVGTCTVSSDSDGMLSALSSGGTWTFTPDALKGLTGEPRATALSSLKVPGVIEDPDYMTFGYWLRQTEGKDGTEYAMSPFHRGARDYEAVTEVVGTATYEGSATGLYMKKSLTPEGDPTGPFESGQFTADVMLQANFGGPNVAQNMEDSITGSVTDFRNDAGGIINENWELMLNTGQPADGAQKNMDDNAGTFSGKTAGKNLAGAEGDWQGRFRGDTYDAGDNPQPGYATGIFDGHFTNGHVRGAFGATKE